MHRFFISSDCIVGDRVTLGGGVARQLFRVLRAGPGERIVVLDSSGWEYHVILEDVTSHRARGTVTQRLRSKGEPRIEITLYQAVLKADRFEFVLQKGTELGVSVFVPVFCSRSVPKDTESGWFAKRNQRWQKIVTEAAEQSHRGWVPIVESPLEFTAACSASEGLMLMPWEQENNTGIRAALGLWRDVGEDSQVSIFMGPEGGFTQQEVEYACSKGAVLVSLGDRILRSETAAVTTVAAVLYETGELGG